MNVTGSLDVQKLHGAQNTFVLVDERPSTFEHYDDLARALCAAGGELGGADGLLVVCDASGAAARMRIFNADGSEAEMCGNGVRCVARYLAERGAGDAFTVATLAGPIATTIVSREPFEARIDVGPVAFPHGARAQTLTALGATWTFYEVSLGNPHAVVFVDDVAGFDLVPLGRAFNAHDRFPRGTNLHLVQLVDGTTLRVRHFERGVGLTQACGTGAVASAVAAMVVRGATSPASVRVPGGTLRVDWQPGESAYLTGPAERIFERTIAR